MSDTYGKHYSVQKEDILKLFLQTFDHEKSLNFCDLTFGAGGHSIALLEQFPNSSIVGFDQDPEAITNGNVILTNNELEERATLIQSNFRDFESVLGEQQYFDGVILDAGVSSHQFDTPERGFSFRFDGPLDMRMNPSSSRPSVEEVVNNFSREELERIIFQYGEEKAGRRIVDNILKKREESPISTTKDLEDICFHSYPKKMRFGKTHPATKTFQALRIFVNEELDVLSEIIGQVVPRLSIGGLFAVISFHSLEDRIVKHSFKDLMKADIPVEILTKKPILPSEKEIFENSRSRSAKLRVVRRLEKWPNKNKYKN